MAQSAFNTAPPSPLATLLDSDAPAALKLEAQSILTALASCCPGRLDAAAAAALPPALLARCGAIPPGLDLFRILRGEPPVSSSHRRTHVAASLRYVRARKGRAPVAADYPHGHPVPVLACAYYGGLAAWGAGAPGRTQQPKGHWHQRAHQEAALRDVAARFPDLPLTHATLERAGFHALARALSAEQLTALLEALGLDRRLARRPNGWWTAERALDRYAALCREAGGVTLSNHALARQGGLGCTLRVEAARHFDSFAAFQQAAARRHPALRPPKRPTAQDGTVLDSWAEVVTYQAIRLAFPEMAVAVHVVLPDSGGRSCDLVLGNGQAWIEVLGLSRAEMAAPGSAHQHAYAGRWAVKEALYRERGLPLVLVEPADIADPARLAVRLGEVAGLLALPPPLVPATTERTERCVRAKGTWTFDFLCEAVGEVGAEVGGFPTHAELARHGYGSAAEYLKRPGLAERVAAVLGIPLRNRKGQWTPERIIADHVAWVCGHGGAYPSEAALTAAGQRRLVSARRRVFRGRQDALRAEVGRRCGLVLHMSRRPAGSCAGQDGTAKKVGRTVRRRGQVGEG